MHTGTVRLFNPKEGYGFISRRDPGRDVFVHIRDVESGVLAEGVTVSFELTMGERGPRAQSIRRVESD